MIFKFKKFKKDPDFGLVSPTVCEDDDSNVGRQVREWKEPEIENTYSVHRCALPVHSCAQIIELKSKT
jgi:hypothetical protein